ncbi:hypothetical protein, conserved [Trypanosoma brucei gambiense DAL972]|uniref:EF-hand domain-containing protein n=2 Tax=Trypanosoma brucei TaxID=5691 RepID=C9ZSK0_TRYB9|nr:hypothetical protein, conserved [Trypanosoma brucei gambiense DAL972]RHW71466.1 EF-hand domain pair/EF-hand domain/EF hand [Trypanosoma brucei equiperdum]CBH12384.1 hypothetical protein, conserved [Trypanosoma brucei gambiense DAL972]|eukprot:XP_011774665.1 hypothetical protein, conserved [Trypanosoma brucei gambiense DAL972]
MAGIRFAATGAFFAAVGYFSVDRFINSASWWALLRSSGEASAEDGGSGGCIRRRLGSAGSVWQRFNQYSTPGAAGVQVLRFLDFVACVCLLDEEDRQRLHSRLCGAPTEGREDLCSLFKLVDTNASGTVTYDEFCVLITLLSACQRHLKIAFGAFDVTEEDSLSRDGFRRIINTLMVDPTVQIVERTGHESDVHSHGGGRRDGGLTSSEFLSSNLVKLFFGVDEDARISFDDFWTVVRRIQWMVRRVEFQLYDTQNTGRIKLHQLQKILFPDRYCSTQCEEGHSDEESRYVSSRLNCLKDKFVSWDLYMKVFDVLCETESIVRGMNLALNARDPEGRNDHASCLCHRDDSMTPIVSVLTDTAAGLTTSHSGRDRELDYVEFHRVLQSCDHLKHLTKSDAEEIVEIFDIDGSGKLSPDEFGKMSRMCTSFFMRSTPLFLEPRRNTIQRFVYCMQQLR